MFEHSRCAIRNGRGEFGGTGLIRTVIEWRKYDNPGYDVDAQSLPLLFAAEFDLRTGAVKWISFYDPTILGWKEKRNGK